MNIESLIEKITPLKRDIISDGYDKALKILSENAPIKIHRYPSNIKCWTWIIPQKWACEKATLLTLKGKEVFSYQDCPLHVMSYSEPYNGILTREDLFKHLYVKNNFESAIPFTFSYYKSDWGLCCSKKQKELLDDDAYRVVIESEKSNGDLKVGEVFLKGKSDKCFVLCAHLCHPAQLNDGLCGVLAGLEIMKRLASQKKINYSYRLLIVPETIGSIAYLSHNEELISTMFGGLFLEMLGLDSPHAIQKSFAGNTEVDDFFIEQFKKYDEFSYVKGFREIVANDERQFNAPGVRIPMLSISRIPEDKILKNAFDGKITKDELFFPEYHTNFDNIDSFNYKKFYESVDILTEMILKLDNTEFSKKHIENKIIQRNIPKNNYKGEIFLSRYNFSTDYYSSDHTKHFYNVMMSIDGNTSIKAISKKVGVEIDIVNDIVNILRENDLVV